jgi:SPASM domain peptide maturase of grasp-with-spasm system
MNQKNIFHAFACCIPVKGYNRSIICDIQRGTFDFIPNMLYELLLIFRGKSVKYIKEYYENNHDEIIDEYFDFLISKEYGFWTTEEDYLMFPPIDLHWESPEKLTNIIVDVDKHRVHDFTKIAHEIEENGIKALQVRFIDEIDVNKVDEIMSCFQDSRLRHVGILIKFTESLNLDTLTNLCVRHPRILQITLHSSFKDLDESINKNGTILCHSTKVFDSANCCGVISPQYFSVNMDTFTEAYNFNSCLNKKISIDVNGFIKNCPSMEQHFGHIEKTTFANVIKDTTFTNNWAITKDQIEVCKDCEFRYICTDCRAYQSKETILSKPTKCGYSPYTNEWKS